MLGTFAKAFVCMALGQSAAEPTANDVIYSNSRAQKVEANFPESRRAEIRELLLFASQDRGETWGQVSKMGPDQREFTFSVPVDGSFWLRVAVVNRAGRQEPENLYKVEPNWRLVIDTLRPLVKILSATRQGAETTVQWEIREDHPEWTSFRIEYVSSPGGLATPVTSAPGLTGQARFTPSTNGPITVRVILRDKAGNESVATAEVPGREGFEAASFTPPPASAAPVMPPPLAAPPVAQMPIAPPPAEMPPALTQASLPPAAPPQIAVQSPPQMPTPTPPPPSTSHPESFTPPPVAMTGTSIPGNPGAMTYPAAERKTLTPPVALAPVGSNRWSPQPPPGPTPLAERPIASTENTIQQVQYQTPIAPPATPRRPLPPLQYVNSPEVVLEYELSKVGPSGVGSVDIYLTQDDGQNWDHVATDPAVIGKTTGGRHQGIVELPGDGIYGFNLVVKSQAQIRNEMSNLDKKGKGPRDGDVPEIRVEVDTVPPTAELFPPRRDPSKANSLLLIWNANDKNLGSNPVTLEWSERREGPWFPIAANIANSGKHSWQLPDRLPVQVYMRLRVRDLASNEGVALTPDPQLVDLSEPEGRLVNVSVPPRR